jgi:hypothetical protein
MLPSSTQSLSSLQTSGCETVPTLDASGSELHARKSVALEKNSVSAEVTRRRPTLVIDGLFVAMAHLIIGQP